MKITTSNFPLYTVQENGLISQPHWAEGRLIAAVVLNSSTDSTLQELLKIHVTNDTPGDATVQWGWPVSQFFKPKTWELIVTFTKPIEFSFHIEFVLEKHYALMDAIFQSRGLYIMYGNAGQKISTRTNENIVLIEVPDTENDELWNSKLFEIIKSKLKKEGVPKRNLNNEVRKQIKERRDFLHYRK